MYLSNFTLLLNVNTHVMIINIHYDDYDLKIAHLKFINRSISITSWCYNIKKLNKESFVDRFIIEPATTVCADLDWRLISYDGRKSQSQVSHWTGRSRESSWYMLLQSVFSPEPVPRARLAFCCATWMPRKKYSVSFFFVVRIILSIPFVAHADVGCA